MLRRTAFRALLLADILFTAAAWAQLSTTATITGTITDASSGLVPAASVKIVNEDTHASIDTVTNGSGTFVAPGLSVGTYSVTISKPGFQSYTESHIVLHPATTATVNATLQPGEVGTKISVTASGAQIQTTTSEVSNSVSEVQAETLPLNGRNFQALAAVMPGVVNRNAGSALGQGGRATSNVLSV